MTGAEFKIVREEFGLGASDFARHLGAIGAPVTTGRSVYRVESQKRVPRWCVEALRKLVGDDAFCRAISELGIAAAERSAGSETPTEIPHRKAGRGAPAARRDAGFPQRTEEDYLALLTALPLTARTIRWLTSFREALQQFLGDVDRVSINLDHHCDILGSGRIPSDMIVTEHLEVAGDPSIVFVTLQKDEGSPSERLLREFRQQGHPLDQYHPPFSTDYDVDGSYLGTLFLWRECSKGDISSTTIALVERLRTFITFALIDAVALQRSARPFDEAFSDALAYMRHDASLSEQESRVAILQLYGHSYRQIAERLSLALDTVRTHIRNIYRKTGTKSSAGLFAKYFTQRLGI